MAKRNRKHIRRKYCAAYGCLNNETKTPDIHFFMLPKDTERRRKWLTSIDREDLLNKQDIKHSSYFICSEHFDDTAVETIVMKKLVKDAVPTKQAFKKSENTENKEMLDVKLSVSVETQTDLCQLPQKKMKAAQTSKGLGSQTPQKRKLVTEIQKSQSKCQRLYKEFKHD